MAGRLRSHEHSAKFFWLDQSFSGPGAYTGLNIFSEAFALNVMATVAEPSDYSTDISATSAHFMAELVGPTFVSVYVMGLAVEFNDGAAIHTGVVLGARLSGAGLAAATQLHSIYNVPPGIWNTLTPTQQTCVWACEQDCADAINSALIIWAAATAAFTAAYITAIAACLVFTGWTIIGGLACTTAALYLFLAAEAAAAAAYAVALAYIHVAYVDCLRACGLSIAYW